MLSDFRDYYLQKVVSQRQSMALYYQSEEPSEV
jgi:hypothetical protein